MSEESERAFEQGGYVKTELLRGPWKDKPISQTTTYYGCPEGKDSGSINANPSELAVSSDNKDDGTVPANTRANPVESIKAAISRAIVNFIGPNNRSLVNYDINNPMNDYDDELIVNDGTAMNSSRLYENTQNRKKRDAFTSASSVSPTATFEPTQLNNEQVIPQPPDAQNKQLIENENALTNQYSDSDEGSEKDSKKSSVDPIVQTPRAVTDTDTAANQAVSTEVYLDKLKQDYITALEKIKNDANVGVHSIKDMLEQIKELYEKFKTDIENIHTTESLIAFAQTEKFNTEQVLYEQIANDIIESIKVNPSEQIVNMVCENQMIDIKNNPINLDGEKYNLPKPLTDLILKKIKCIPTIKSGDLLDASQNLNPKKKLDFYTAQLDFIKRGVYVQTEDEYNLLKDGGIIVKKIQSSLKNYINGIIHVLTKQLEDETKKKASQTDPNIVKGEDDNNSYSGDVFEENNDDEIPEYLDSDAYNSEDESEEEKKEEMDADLDTLKKSINTTRPPGRIGIRPGRQIATINQALSDAINKKIKDILINNVPKEKSIVPLEQKSMGDIKQLLTLRIEDYISKFELFKIIEDYLANSNSNFNADDINNSKEIYKRTQHGILAVIPILKDDKLVLQATNKFKKENLAYIIDLFKTDFRYVLAIPFTDENILYYIANLTQQLKMDNIINQNTTESRVMRDYIRFSFIPFQLAAKEYDGFVSAYQYKITEQTYALAGMVKNTINIDTYFVNFHYYLAGFLNGKKNTTETNEEDANANERAVETEKSFADLNTYFRVMYTEKIIHIGELISIYNFFENRQRADDQSSENLKNRIACALFFWDIDMNQTKNIFYAKMKDYKSFDKIIQHAGEKQLKNADDNLVKYNQKLNNARIMTFLKINQYAGNFNHGVYRPIVRNGNELLLGFRNVMSGNNETHQKNWKYFSLGQFNKIYLPSNNTETSNKEIVVGKSKDEAQKVNEPMYKCVDLVKAGKDVFIIGYGSSGSGKTSTLIYNTTTHEEGAAAALCLEVCNSFNAKLYKKNAAIKKSNDKIMKFLYTSYFSNSDETYANHLSKIKEKLENPDKKYNQLVSYFNRQIEEYNKARINAKYRTATKPFIATKILKKKRNPCTQENNSCNIKYNKLVLEYNKHLNKTEWAKTRLRKKIDYMHSEINVVKMTVFEIKGKISKPTNRFRRVLYFETSLDLNSNTHSLKLCKSQTVVNQFDKPKIQSSKNDETLGSYLKHFIADDRLIHTTMNNPESSRSHVICTLSFCYKEENNECLASNKKIYPIEELGKIIVGDFAGVENEFDSTNEPTFMKFYDKLAVSTYDNMFKLPEKEADCKENTFDETHIKMVRYLFSVLSKRNGSDGIVPVLRLNRTDSSLKKTDFKTKKDTINNLFESIFNNEDEDEVLEELVQKSLMELTEVKDAAISQQKKDIKVNVFKDDIINTIIVNCVNGTEDCRFKNTFKTITSKTSEDFKNSHLPEAIKKIVTHYCSNGMRNQYNKKEINKSVKEGFVEMSKNNYTEIEYNINQRDGLYMYALTGKSQNTSTYRQQNTKPFKYFYSTVEDGDFSIHYKGLQTAIEYDDNDNKKFMDVVKTQNASVNNLLKQKRAIILKFAGYVFNELMRKWVKKFNEIKEDNSQTAADYQQINDKIRKKEKKLLMENQLYFNAHAFFGYLHHKKTYSDGTEQTPLLEDSFFDKLFSSRLLTGIREHEELNFQKKILPQEKEAYKTENKRIELSPADIKTVTANARKKFNEQIDNKIRFVLEREMKPVVQLLNAIKWKINRLPIPRTPTYIKQKAIAIVMADESTKREEEINHLEYLYDFVHDVQRISEHINDRKKEGYFINAELANIRKDLIQCMLIKSKNHIFTAPNMNADCTSTFCKNDDVCFTIKKPKHNTGDKTVIESETFKYLKIMNKKKNKKMQELREKRLEQEKKLETQISKMVEKLTKDDNINDKQLKELQISDFSFDYDEDDYTEADYMDTDETGSLKKPDQPNDLIYNFYNNLQISIFTVFNMNDTTDNPPNVTYIDNYNDNEGHVTQNDTFSIDPFLVSNDKSTDVKILYDKMIVTYQGSKSDLNENQISYEIYDDVVKMLDNHNATTTLGTLIFTDNMAKFGNEPAPDMNRMCVIEQDDWKKQLKNNANGNGSSIKTVPPDNTTAITFQKTTNDKTDTTTSPQQIEEKTPTKARLYNDYEEKGAVKDLHKTDEFYKRSKLNEVLVKYQNPTSKDKRESKQVPKRPYTFYDYKNN